MLRSIVLALALHLGTYALAQALEPHIPAPVTEAAVDVLGLIVEREARRRRERSR